MQQDVGDNSFNLNIIERSKFVSLFFIIIAILYNASLHFILDIDVCKGLLKSGRYLNDEDWQPDMCMIHRYSNEDTFNCLQYMSYFGEENNYVFIGDSSTRELYKAFQLKVTNLVSFSSNENNKQEYANISVISERINLKLDFYWYSGTESSLVELFSKFLLKRCKPKLILFGFFLNSIKQSFDSSTSSQNLKLDKLTKVIHSLSNYTRILWMTQDVLSHKRDDSSSFNEQAVGFLRNRLLKSKAISWSSSHKVRALFNSDVSNSSEMFMNINVNILLNYICNDVMGHLDATCCVSKTPLSSLQIFFLVFAATVLAVFCASMFLLHAAKRKLLYHNYALNYDDQDNYPFLKITLYLSLIVIYLYLCDRSDLFTKENKSYNHTSFFVPVIYSFILAAFFSTTTRDAGILNRDQTDEMKGWMQIVILIYHFTGASQIKPIYVQMRIFVSMYFFLSAFGHFSYLVKTGDYSIRRFIKVILRLNLLVMMLCLVMNRSYDFYYFIPLVTMTFVVVYFIVATPPNLHKDTGNIFKIFLFGCKFVIIVFAVSLLHTSNDLMENLYGFIPLNLLFKFDEDSFAEWIFRWSLDRYTFIYGALFAWCLIIYQKFFSVKNPSNDEDDDKLFSKYNLITFLGPLSLILMYAVTVNNLSSKQEYNSYHHLLSIVPILAYIFLRNANKFLMSHYSYLMASVGRISLELFLCQYHIWLAADTHGILILFPYLPSSLNVLISTFIFVCVSHTLNCITTAIINSIV